MAITLAATTGACSSDSTPGGAGTESDAGATADAASPASEAGNTPDTGAIDSSVTETGATDATTTDSNVEPDASDAAAETSTSGGTATWTLDPKPTCTTSTVAPTCGDGGAVGGYQMVATAVCTYQNMLTVYLPGGSVPPTGTYTVKPASNVVQLANLTAGQVAVRVIYHPNISTQEEWYAQSGTVTVTNTGGHLSYSATDLPTKKDGQGTAANLTLSATCN